MCSLRISKLRGPAISWEYCPKSVSISCGVEIPTEKIETSIRSDNPAAMMRFFLFAVGMAASVRSKLQRSSTQTVMRNIIQLGGDTFFKYEFGSICRTQSCSQEFVFARVCVRTNFCSHAGKAERNLPSPCTLFFAIRYVFILFLGLFTNHCSISADYKKRDPEGPAEPCDQRR